MTVQAPQTPCSHPTWVPVRQRILAQEVAQQRSCFDRARHIRFVDADGDRLLMLEAFRGSRGSRRREGPVWQGRLRDVCGNLQRHGYPCWA